MQSNKYWQDRFTMLQDAQMKKGEAYIADLEEQFRKAQQKVQAQIEVWYQRFASNNEIDLVEAKKLLSGRELKEFKWDVNEYIKFGEENAMNQQWMKELENASARVHVSRLEALKLQMQQQVEVLYGNHLDGTDKLMKQIYSDGYYHTAFEIQKGFNIGWDLHKFNDDQLQKVISKPWTTDGKTFSDRIWSDKRDLIGTLQTGLTQSIIRGDNPKDLIKSIAQKFNVKKDRAARLVMTESAFFASESQRSAFNDLDVELYEIVATLDNRTSEICQDLDGKIFSMKDFEVGSTAPPFHPWCRTCTAPWFDDLGGERIARGADGKTYFVPSDMKFEDWKRTFVDFEGSKKRFDNLRFDKEQYSKYKSVLGDLFEYTFEDFQNMKYSDNIKWKTAKSDFRKVSSYNRIISSEPTITSDLKRIENKADSLLVGLEYRLKTLESYLRKVASDSNYSMNIKLIDDVVSNTNDVIRYTFQSDVDDLAEQFNIIDLELKNSGYKLVKLKNTWMVKSNPYKGINCIYESPDGQKFEIQFHTEESFELKNGEMHKLYEVARLDSTTDKERTELFAKMFELSSKLKVPRNIKNVGR